MRLVIISKTFLIFEIFVSVRRIKPNHFIMSHLLPKGVKLERKKIKLLTELKLLFDGIEVKDHLFDVVRTAVCTAELALYTRKGKTGIHKKEIVLRFLTEACHSVERDLLSKMIDSIAETVRDPSLWERLRKFLSGLFERHRV